MRQQQHAARSDAGSLLIESRTSYSVRITFRLKRWFSALKVAVGTHPRRVHRVAPWTCPLLHIRTNVFSVPAPSCRDAIGLVRPRKLSALWLQP